MEQEKLRKNQERMNQISEQRRMQITGSREEKAAIAKQHHAEAQAQLNLKQAKRQDEMRRDYFENERCNEVFQKNCRQAYEQELRKNQFTVATAHSNVAMKNNQQRIATEMQVKDQLQDQ